MFVPFEPDSPLDVYRNDEKCVCGASPLLTNKGGEYHGYCNACAKKRQTFADNIISTIHINKDDHYRYAILNTLESIRVSLLKERIYYLVDKYFSDNQSNETFSEPYERADFKLKVLREKCRIQEDFINKIPFTEMEEKLTFSKRKELTFIYNSYIRELNSNYDWDKRKIESLCNSLSEDGPKLSK